MKIIDGKLLALFKYMGVPYCLFCTVVGLYMYDMIINNEHRSVPTVVTPIHLRITRNTFILVSYSQLAMNQHKQLRQAFVQNTTIATPNMDLNKNDEQLVILNQNKKT